MSFVKFESMLKTNNVYFFDLTEFEEIIIHYIDIGKHSLAKKAVKLGLEQHPDSIDLKLLEIELCVFEDKIALAKKLLRQVEILEPNNDEVFIQKATIVSKEGKHKEAIENLIKALTLTDDKEDIWSLLGMEYLYLDDFENARLNFINCVNADIEDYSSLYNVVYCFDMEKLHEEAIEYLIMKDIPNHIWRTWNESNKPKMVICTKEQLPQTREWRNAWKIDPNINSKEMA